MIRRPLSPRIVGVSGACDVIAVLNPNGAAQPFLARFIPIQFHSITSPTGRSNESGRAAPKVRPDRVLL